MQYVDDSSTLLINMVLIVFMEMYSVPIKQRVHLPSDADKMRCVAGTHIMLSNGKGLLHFA